MAQPSNGNQTIADVSRNLDKVNQYGFKNGIEGLAEMSRISKIFRMDMESTFTVASKVMDPEGAVEMSSRLQALGGAFGKFHLHPGIEDGVFCSCQRQKSRAFRFFTRWTIGVGLGRGGRSGRCDRRGAKETGGIYSGRRKTPWHCF